MRLKNKFLTYLFLLCYTLSIFQNIKPIGGNDSCSQEFRDGIIIDNNSGDQVNHVENVLADVGSGLLRMADDLDEGQLDLKYSLTNLGMNIFEIGRANMFFFPLAELEMMNRDNKSKVGIDPLDLHAKRVLERWQKCKDDPKRYFKESLINLAESTDKISKVLSPLFAEECVNDLREEGFVEESAKAALIYQQQTKETVEKLKIVLNHLHSLPREEKVALIYDLIIPDSPEDVATFALSKFFKGARKLANIVKNAEPIINEVKKLSIVEKELMFLGWQSNRKLKITPVTNSFKFKVNGGKLLKQNGPPLVTMKAINIAEENFKKFASEISKIIPEVTGNSLFQLIKEAVPGPGDSAAYQKMVEFDDCFVYFRRDIDKHAHKLKGFGSQKIDHYNIEIIKKTGLETTQRYYNHHIIVDKDFNIIDDFGEFVGKYGQKNKEVISITRDLQVDKNIGDTKKIVEAAKPNVSCEIGNVDGGIIGDLVAAKAVGILCRDEGIKDLDMDVDENEFLGESIFTQTKHLFANPEVNDDKNPTIQTNTTKKTFEDNKQEPIVILANPPDEQIMEVDSIGTKPKEKNKIVTDGVTNIVKEQAQEIQTKKEFEIFIDLPPVPSVFDNVGLRKGNGFVAPQRIKQKKELYIDKLNEKRQEAVSASYFYQYILEDKNSSRSSKWDAEKKLEFCKQDCEKIDREFFALGRYKNEKPWNVNDPVATLIGELSVDYRFYSADGESFTKFFVKQLNQYFLKDTFFSSLSHLENYEEEFLKLWNSKKGIKKIKKALNLGGSFKNIIKGNFRDQAKAKRRFEACEKFADKCKKSLADKEEKKKMYRGLVQDDQNLKERDPGKWLLSHLDRSSEVEVTTSDLIGSLQVNVIDVLQFQMEELTDQKKKDLFEILYKAKEDSAFKGKTGKQLKQAFDALQEFDKEQTIFKQKKLEFRDHADKVRDVLVNATIIGQVNADNYDSLSEHEKIKYNLWKKLQSEQKKKEVEAKEQQSTEAVVQQKEEINDIPLKVRRKGRRDERYNLRKAEQDRLELAGKKASLRTNGIFKPRASKSLLQKARRDLGIGVGIKNGATEDIDLVDKLKDGSVVAQEKIKQEEDVKCKQKSKATSGNQVITGRDRRLLANKIDSRTGSTGIRSHPIQKKRGPNLSLQRTRKERGISYPPGSHTPMVVPGDGGDGNPTAGNAEGFVGGDDGQVGSVVPATDNGDDKQPVINNGNIGQNQNKSILKKTFEISKQVVYEGAGIVKDAALEAGPKALGAGVRAGAEEAFRIKTYQEKHYPVISSRTGYNGKNIDYSNPFNLKRNPCEENRKANPILQRMMQKNHSSLGSYNNQITKYQDAFFRKTQQKNFLPSEVMQNNIKTQNDKVVGSGGLPKPGVDIKKGLISKSTGKTKIPTIITSTNPVSKVGEHVCRRIGEGRKRKFGTTTAEQGGNASKKFS